MLRSRRVLRCDVDVSDQAGPCASLRHDVQEMCKPAHGSGVFEKGLLSAISRFVGMHLPEFTVLVNAGTRNLGRVPRRGRLMRRLEGALKEKDPPRDDAAKKRPQRSPPAWPPRCWLERAELGTRRARARTLRMGRVTWPPAMPAPCPHPARLVGMARAGHRSSCAGRRCRRSTEARALSHMSMMSTLGRVLGGSGHVCSMYDWLVR